MTTSAYAYDVAIGENPWARCAGYRAPARATSGLDFLVQAERSLTLHEAHELSGRVKAAIRAAVPEVGGVLIHTEPFTESEIDAMPK